MPLFAGIIYADTAQTMDEESKMTQGIYQIKVKGQLDNCSMTLKRKRFIRGRSAYGHGHKPWFRNKVTLGISEIKV